MRKLLALLALLLPGCASAQVPPGLVPGPVAYINIPLSTINESVNQGISNVNAYLMSNSPLAPQNTTPNALNLYSTAVPNGRLGIDNTLSANGSNLICFVGDSTTAGANASSYLYYPTATFAAAMARAGLPVRADQTFLAGTINSAIGADSRVVVGSGYSSYNNYLLYNSNTNTITFTPTDSVTSFDVWYYDNLAGNTFGIKIDSGSTTTVTLTGTSTYKKATISASAGTHTLTITPGTGTLYFAMISAYNTGVNDTRIINLGASGTTTANWTGGGITPNNLALALGCNTYFINLTINDADNGVAIPMAMANLQALITQLQNGGAANVILVIPTPTNYNATIATQLAYAAMLTNVANGSGPANSGGRLPLINLYGWFGSWAQMSAGGFNGGNILHPNSQGYEDVGRFEWSVFSQVVGR